MAASTQQLQALTKIMLSMGYSYGDINDVRDVINKSKAGGVLVSIAEK